MSLALAGGLGAVLGIFAELYAPEGYGPSEISLLLTLPSLCIGLGKILHGGPIAQLTRQAKHIKLK